MTGHVTIRFYDITISFFLNANSDKRIDVWDYGFVNKEKTS